MTGSPALAASASPSAPRRVSTLAVVGDSVAVGLGDPGLDGGWRGVAHLVRDALGAGRLLNPARTGARAACVRRQQLPVALAARPQVAVLVVGMNDTLRADFDPPRLREDYAAIVEGLHAVGAHVVLLRYHDHTRIFWLPAPLRGALRRRVAALNGAVDAVARIDTCRTAVVDLHALPGCHDRAAWTVDRLHPSERGHRLLAAAIVATVAEAGFAVPRPVTLDCAGGRAVTRRQQALWLVAKGVPWLARRATFRPERRDARAGGCGATLARNRPDVLDRIPAEAGMQPIGCDASRRPSWAGAADVARAAPQHGSAGRDVAAGRSLISARCCLAPRRG